MDAFGRTKKLCLALAAASLTACVSMVAQGLANDLSTAIANQDDPATVGDGAPAYLLLIDGLAENRPHDVNVLVSAARLYSTYAAVFVNDPERAKRLTDKARRYGRDALCVRDERVCAGDTGPYDEFVTLLAHLDKDDVPALYTFASAWAGWIQAHADEWGAIADLPKVESMMERVVDLWENYDHGQAHLYLGVMRTQIPPAAGGRPELGQAHFERAIVLSEGRNLVVKVEYARHFARLMFDQTLHDRLLHDVLAADPTVPELTLSNVLAQREARELLATSAQYFEE